MVQTIIQAVSDFVVAFTNDDFGQLVVGIMVFGTAVSLLRLFEAGAGGRDV